MFGKKPRVGVRWAVVAVALCASLVGSSGVASAAGKVPSPPGGVFTCEWIAAHPVGAAKARVTCDLATFLAAATPAVSQPVLPFSQGCASVWGGGGAGSGVFAWSAYGARRGWGPWYACGQLGGFTRGTSRHGVAGLGQCHGPE